MNDYQKRRFVNRMVRAMFNTVSDKRIGVWGFAFKKDTNDTRESAAIYICRDLLIERAKLVIYDPQVLESKIRQDLRDALRGTGERLTDQYEELLEDHVEIVDSPVAAASQSHAVAIMTEWDQFKTLDYAAIFTEMRKTGFSIRR